MKQLILSIILALAFWSCNEIGPGRKRLVRECLISVKETGNVGEVLATHYCKCSADTIMQVFSELELDEHVKLSDNEPHTKHCMKILTDAVVDPETGELRNP